MRTIDLSEATYRRLLSLVQDFGETPEDVVVRLLDIARPGDAPAVARPARANRASPGSILPERAYWRPMLSLIEEAGGAMPASHVMAAMEGRMEGLLTPRDFEQLEQGEPRWRNRVRFARLRMKEQGLLRDDSPRGVWEISDRGRDYLHA